MASFDVKSLFTNVPLDETIDIIINKAFNNATFSFTFIFCSITVFTNKLMVWSWVLLLGLFLPTFF